jgi:hypothetical protein
VQVQSELGTMKASGTTDIKLLKMKIKMRLPGRVVCFFCGLNGDRSILKNENICFVCFGISCGGLG